MYNYMGYQNQIYNQRGCSCCNQHKGGQNQYNQPNSGHYAPFPGFPPNFEGPLPGPNGHHYPFPGFPPNFEGPLPGPNGHHHPFPGYPSYFQGAYPESEDN